MARTKIQIFNRAIGLLNKAPITSFVNGGVFAQNGESTFDDLLESVLATNNWRFATKVAPLTKQTSDISYWQNKYLLPPDYLSLWKIYPESYEFQIYENSLLYSNIDISLIEYRFLPEITLLPAHFIRYFIYLLASELALSGAASESLYEKLNAKAEFHYGLALSTDSQAHPNETVIDNPFFTVRYIDSTHHYGIIP